jgi:hypothetical protein
MQSIEGVRGLKDWECAGGVLYYYFDFDSKRGWRGMGVYNTVLVDDWDL